MGAGEVIDVYQLDRDELVVGVELHVELASDSAASCQPSAGPARHALVGDEHPAGIRGYLGGLVSPEATQDMPMPMNHLKKSFSASQLHWARVEGLLRLQRRQVRVCRCVFP